METKLCHLCMCIILRCAALHHTWIVCVLSLWEISNQLSQKTNKQRIITNKKINIQTYTYLLVICQQITKLLVVRTMHDFCM